MRKKYKLTGSLTVYLALMLSVLLPLCFGLIESVRHKAAQLESMIVTDIGMNSIMAEYHREVLHNYHLFFLDTSYGSREPSFYKTEQHLREYLERNLEYEQDLTLDFLYYDFLQLEAEQVEMDRMSLATDHDGRVFQREALRAVEGDLGLDVLQDIAGIFRRASEAELFASDMDAQIDAATQELSQLDGTQIRLADRTWFQIQITDPAQEVWKVRSEGILKHVTDPGRLSTSVVSLENYVSEREKSGILNRGNGTDPGELSLLEKILLREYFLRYAGFYGQERAGGELQYETEYLLAGKESDIENLKYTANILTGLRFAGNAITLAGDSVKMGELKALAIVCSTAVLLPEAAPAFEAVLFAAWCYLESVYDVKQILGGRRIALIKDRTDWHYSLTNMLKGLVDFGSGEGQGLSYRDYLELLLLTKPDKELSFRFMDLMEMRIRKTEGNENFRMDGCASEVGATVTMHSRFGYRFELTREKSYADP